MSRRPLLTTNLALEGTIDKILKNTESDILSSLKSALDDSQQNLDDSVTKLETEYDKIISDGKKEADKIEKQIVGGSDIEARNKQLLALEAAVDRVFTTALEQITNSDRNSDYANLINTLLQQATSTLGTTEVRVFTNAKDKDVVQSSLSNFSGSELSSETIECIGGVKIESKDGAMKFDNTIDAKIDRLKPLIRKEIASKFGVKE
ncbi:MAG: V-type ATP synthase subunit E [Nitrosopumilus sp.]|jgi:V/A-type H+-transporting ATPase subunit E|nr:V-type ATP synthase subunit E [Nitrosopumilus sp.]|tara:strand:+ start:289 stop:906 length:618 start_codon:yes stop_codon:yes gene_type:complete